MADEPTIAASVGTASASTFGGRGDLAKRIEQAMADAVQQAIVEGVSMENTDEIKQRMMTARERIMAQSAGE